MTFFDLTFQDIFWIFQFWKFSFLSCCNFFIFLNYGIWGSWNFCVFDFWFWVFDFVYFFFIWDFGIFEKFLNFLVSSRVFFFFLWGSSRVCSCGPSNVHVWALGLSCETPADMLWHFQKMLKNQISKFKKRKNKQKKSKTRINKCQNMFKNVQKTTKNVKNVVAQ